MRTFTNQYDTVRCFDLKVWKQEKNLIFFHHEPSEDTADTVKLYTNLHGSSVNPIALYALDGNENAIIDVSDYIRAYPAVSSIIVECIQDDPISIPLQVVGLINPERMLIPALPYEMYEDLTKIVPPTVIYRSAVPSLIDIRGIEEQDQNAGLYPAKRFSGRQEIVEGSNSIPSSWGAIYISVDQEWVRDIIMREVPCGVFPACVEWVGVTGARKRAIWLVEKHTIDAEGVVSLMPVVSDYREIKGRSEGLTIYIDGLSQYDLWYYSDIITSSDVRVLVDDEITADNITGGMIDERFAVDVATNSVTIPDGNAGDFSKLEVKLNWRKYDAVNM